jgi:hypothetical protein
MAVERVAGEVDHDRHRRRGGSAYVQFDVGVVTAADDAGRVKQRAVGQRGDALVCGTRARSSMSGPRTSSEWQTMPSMGSATCQNGSDASSMTGVIDRVRAIIVPSAV